jgi:hypothetical protein
MKFASTKMLLLLVGLFVMTGCVAASFEIEVKGRVARVDVSTLGEYPTSVSRIRLSEADSHKVLWEIVAGKQVPQIWGLTLNVGANPVKLARIFAGRDYRLISPQNKSTFVLRENVRYRLEMWNQGGWWRSSKEFEFASTTAS